MNGRALDLPSKAADSEIFSTSGQMFANLRVVEALVDHSPVTPTPILWEFNPVSLSIALQRPALGVSEGKCIGLTIAFAKQTISFTLRVTKLLDEYGSHLLAIGDICKPADVRSDLQRRANTRFVLPSVFPVICRIENDLDGDDSIVCRVIDVSFGGICLLTSPRNRMFFPGLRVTCSIRTPFDGSYDAPLLVRNVRAEHLGSRLFYRLHCESRAHAGLRNRAMQRHVTRFSSDSLSEKIREKFVPRRFSDLVEHRVIPIERSRTLELGTRFDLFESGDLLPTTFQERAALVGTLGGHIVSVHEVGCGSYKGNSQPAIVASRLWDRLIPDELVSSGNRFIGDRQRANCHGSGTPGASAVTKLGAAQSSCRPEVSMKPVSAREHLLLRATLGESRVRTLLSSRRKQARRSLSKSAKQRVAWDLYAQAYDVMCSVNPAYLENLTRFVQWLQRCGLPDSARVCDVGAGTGNYTIELANRFPRGTVVHLDLDPAMNNAAFQKYRKAGFSNIDFTLASVEDAEFKPETFDLIVCVNALYTFSNHTRVLAKMNRWLATPGLMYTIDLGRPMDVADWSRYIIGSSIKSRGVPATLRAFLRGRQAITQNRHIRTSQDEGKYWLHTRDEFQHALERAGFEVAELGVCYRGFCDFAVCRKTGTRYSRFPEGACAERESA